MQTGHLPPECLSGEYPHHRNTRIFFFQKDRDKNHNAKSVEFIPTGKGTSVFRQAVQGHAASGFWKNHPRSAAVFFQKTLHSLNTDLCLPVE